MTFAAAADLRKQRHSHDLAFVVVLGVVAVLHCLAWANHPPDVDPINFTVALRDAFSPTLDSPHPPGYPLYVLAGRLAATLVGERHAFQLVNLAMLLGSGCLLYWTLRALDAVAVGFASAVLLVIHPLAWAATVIQECYVSDLFFGVAIFAVVVLQRRSPRRLLVGGFIVFFLLGLVRPVSGVMLLPLASLTSFATTRRKALSAGLAAAAVGAVLLAYALTIHLGGGWEAYRLATSRVMGAAFRASSVLGGAPVSAHLKMLSRCVGWCVLLAFPTVLSLLVMASKRAGSVAPGKHSVTLMIGAAWFLPPLAFYCVIYSLKPTYQLIYLPCLLVPIAWFLFGKESILKRPHAALVLSGLVILELGVFNLPLPRLPEPLRRQTRAFFVQQDRAWDDLLRRLEALPKERTLLLWAAHPTLNMYATRLLNREGPMAIAISTRTGVNYFEPRKGRWLSQSEADLGPAAWSARHTDYGRVAEKYEGVIIVDDRAGNASVRHVALAGADPEQREFRYLLQPVEMEEERQARAPELAQISRCQLNNWISCLLGLAGAKVD